MVSVNTDDAEESELIVSLPLSSYTSATLPDATVLHSRISRSNALPAGWTLACLPKSTSYLATFALCKLQIFPPLCMLPLCWQCLLVVHGHFVLARVRLINTNVSFWVELLPTVDEVVKLLSTLDDSKHCVGNLDTKFMQLVLRQKGVFKDQSGKSPSVHC